jgi:uncharacterized delta-60 repeat protein
MKNAILNPYVVAERTPRLTPVALSLFLLLFTIALARAADCYLAAPGCLDATFGGGTGKVLINTDGAVSASYDLDQAKGLAIQADGKIVAAGITTDPANTTINKFGVVRMNVDGSLDSTFGGTGMVATSFSSGSDRAYTVALQSDGKIVVAGKASAGSDNVFAVARYLTDGTLDATFGSGGKTTISFNSSSSGRGNAPKQASDTEGRSIAVQPDGKILVAGFAWPNGALARLNSNGSLDTSFGIGGKVTTSSLSGATVSVALQADGKVVLGGGSASNRKTGTDFAITRYNPNGSIDTTFGSSGVATADFFGLDDRIFALVVDANNNIIAVGNARSGGSGLVYNNFGIARFTSTGTLDGSFGTGGKVMTDVFGNWDDCYAVAIQPDGKIVASGFSYAAGGGQAYSTLVRYNSNGTLDGSFGVGGIVTTNMAGGPDNWAYAVAIQSDGKIVTGGTADTANAGDGFFVALARYYP